MRLVREGSRPSDVLYWRLFSIVDRLIDGKFRELSGRLNRLGPMPLSSGDKLGPYQILASIGAGGMGQVYRARDPRLNRDVAIKVSASQFSERFEREAKAIASLNHPNICQIYDVGPNYLVMDLLRGLRFVALSRSIKYSDTPCRFAMLSTPRTRKPLRIEI